MQIKNMEIKNLAKGRLKYFELRYLDLTRGLRKTTPSSAVLGGIFFRAKNMDLITDNVESIKGKCVGNILLNRIPIGIEKRFFAGHRMKFWGIRTGVVRIKKCKIEGCKIKGYKSRGYKFLEIEIVPGKVYLYSCVNRYLRCEFLKLAHSSTILSKRETMRDTHLMNDHLRRTMIWRREKGEEEATFLMGELLEWGIPLLKTKPPNTIIWDAMQEHIKASAKKTGKSEKELLDYLFESENHKTWISRFKDLDKEETQ